MSLCRCIMFSFPFFVYTHSLFIYIYLYVGVEWVGMLFFPPLPPLPTVQHNTQQHVRHRTTPGIFHVIIGASHRQRIYVQTLQHPAIFFDGDDPNCEWSWRQYPENRKPTWKWKRYTPSVHHATIEAIGTGNTKSNTLKYKWKTPCLSALRVKYSRILY